MKADYVRIGKYQYKMSDEYKLGTGTCGDVYLGYYARDESLFRRGSTELHFGISGISQNINVDS